LRAQRACRQKKNVVLDEKEDRLKSLRENCKIEASAAKQAAEKLNILSFRAKRGIPPSLFSYT
jgi:hypothetical protein